jgi:hypothetical protein
MARRRLVALSLALFAAVTMAVVGTTSSVTAAPSAAVGEAPAGSGPLLTTLDGRVLRPVVIPTSRGAGGARATAAVGRCSLNGSPPMVLPAQATDEGIVTFSALFFCDVPGELELTLGLQQRDLLGDFVNRKIDPPWTTPSPGYNGFSINYLAGCTPMISTGTWRGIAHPRLITPAVIYDFGWNATVEVSLHC